MRLTALLPFQEGGGVRMILAESGIPWTGKKCSNVN